jgi:hypothetical protein
MSYTEIQSRKVISSYGGVGSIIETPVGAMLIENFDAWKFFKAIVDEKLDKSDYLIEDNRLLNRLKNERGFPRLSGFLRIPSNVANPNNQSAPLYADRFISSKYFPEWFYCNKCERFHHILDWWHGWRRTLTKYREPNEKIREVFLKSPKCFYCYDEAKTKQKSDKKRRKFYYELEQVRFILTSPKGDIKDIPWDKWNIAKKVSQDNESRLTIKMDEDEICCENQQLRYYKSTKFSDLSGIRISCSNCKKSNTLAGLFKLDMIVEESTKINQKVVIRTSNSVYYPILVSSIYLPAHLEIRSNHATEIDEWLSDREPIDQIVKIFKKRGYTKEAILRYINSKTESIFEPEEEYRLKEFRFLTYPDRISYPEDDDENRNLIFGRQKLLSLEQFGISNLTQIKRLKITTVQVAYTRQEPLNQNQFLQGGNDDLNIKAKYTSKWANQTEYLPAVESYGEGIFICLDNEKIEKWLDESFRNEIFSSRIATIKDNIENHDYIEKDKFKSDRHLGKFILIHTLSHILIKELEFLVGYPATSLNERLFIDETEMSGVLIYTVAGSEGSFGGLASQGIEEIFERILKSALFRATDCASDPICFNTIDGQGVGGLNLAACYSCSLLPETSCEEFNSFLDRGLLIDIDNGFFKNNWES